MNDAHCDVGLNLHCNGSGSSKPNGLRLYTPSKGAVKQESYAIAKTMAPIYCRITGMRNGGVSRSRGYISLNYSKIPIILVEMGYMTNKHDDLLLGSDEFQTRIAQALTESLCAYFN